MNLISNLVIAIVFGASIFFSLGLIASNYLISALVGLVAGGIFFVFMNIQSKKREREDSPALNKNARQYVRRFSIAIVSYIVLLLISVSLINRFELAQGIQIAVAILPMIPVSFGVWAYMQWVRNLDELQQKIQLEAIGFSMAMTGIISFTIGFLENAGIPQPGLIWIFPMMIMFWGIGQFIALRRYE